MAALAFVSVMGWAGEGSWSNFGSAALADVSSGSLSASAVYAIQSAVQTALANIPPGLTGIARADAVSQALAQVTATEVSIYGAAAVSTVVGSAISDGIPAARVVADVLRAAVNAGVPAATAISDIVTGAVSAGASATQIAEAVIAVSARDDITNNSVGSGLGQAAALLAANNPNAANEIAQVVSNEGTSGTGNAFASAVVANGGSQQLADEGYQNPNAGTGGTNQGSVFGNSIGNGQGSAQSNSSTTISCTNPSCN